MYVPENQTELYTWLGNYFGLTDLPLGVPISKIGHGKSIAAIINGGYDIGQNVREQNGGQVNNAAITDMVNQISEDLRNPRLEALQSTDPERYALICDGRETVSKHRDTIVRIAQELWELFPEIQRRFSCHPDHAKIDAQKFFDLVVYAHDPFLKRDPDNIIV